MVIFLCIFLVSLIFNNFLINNLNNKDLSITLQNLEYIQRDLERISFPVNFQINSLLISLILSFIITALIKLTVVKDFSVDNPISIMTDITKIFFIYSGTIFAVLYLLRFYNLSRGFLLLGIFVFPILLYLLIFFLQLEVFKNLSSFRVVKIILPVILLFSIGYLVFQRVDNEEATLNYSNTIEEIDLTTTTLYEIAIGSEEPKECLPWSGSENFTECISGSTIVSAEKWSDSLNNVVFFEENMFVIDVSGKVFKNDINNIYLDLSDIVFDRTIWNKGELGLFSMAFHPTEKYFLISYVNYDNNLEVAKYFLDENSEPIVENREIIYKLASDGHMHYGGNLIWSEFFEDFLLSVGDNFDETFDTITPRSKILFVNKKISEPELISPDSNAVPRNDILAFGLRNPWKTSEYKNYLFIPDIQQYTQEELNVVDLNEFKKTKKPYLFGWPYFEASLVHEPYKNLCNGQDKKIPETCDAETGIFFDTLIHQDGQSKNLEKYILDNSIKPVVYYDHDSPEIYRAAIIGGGVITDKDSRFFEHYIYADYISNELFAYDFINDELKMVTLDTLGAPITSLIIHQLKSNTVLLTTRDGQLIEVLLP